MIKGNLSSFLTAPGSEFPPGRHFQHTARELFHLLGTHLTPQASSSPGVFHMGPSITNDNLPPLCEVVVVVQREQAWKQQVRRKKTGRASRLEATHLNPCPQTPNTSGDEGEKEKKDLQPAQVSTAPLPSSWHHPQTPSPSTGKVLQSADPQTHGTPIPNAEQKRSQLHKTNVRLQQCRVSLHWL